MRRIAIPSTHPGGLEADVDDHFGHCDLFTIVEVESNVISSVITIPNAPHQQGGCLAPISILEQQGVNALIAAGMGRRPLMGFHQAGIEVFHSAGISNVELAVKALLKGELAAFVLENVCGGGENCSH